MLGPAALLLLSLPGAGPVVDLSAGATHTCAVREDGTAWCWGDGAATRADGVAPHRVRNAKRVTAVAAGDRFTCLLHRSGRVRCFGEGTRGQLGDGTRFSRPAPTRAVLTDGASITAGGSHACALTKDGAVRCWGENRYGQVGDGSRRAVVPAPTPVRGLDPALAVSAGTDHTCALTRAGEVYCWGAGFAGQLGHGALRGARAPVRVRDVEGANALWVGASHACARTTAGAVLCWGSGAHGELLDEGADDRSLPHATATSPAALALGDAFTCTLDRGELRCVGKPFAQALRLDAEGETLLAAGGKHVCLARGDAVRCAGHGGDGQLGQAGATGSRHPSPSRVDRVSALRLNAAEDHTCARTENGRVCWGKGRAHASAWAPKIDLPKGLPGSLVDVGRGDLHACALNDRGQVWCWGEGGVGQLGHGAFEARARPVRVRGVPRVIELDVGAFHACARDDAGDVWCWGNALRGELGPDRARASARPVKVAGVRRVVELGVGRHHACARTRRGDVACWGRGDRGELGDGTGQGSRWPVAVLGVRPARSLAVGGEHACAVIDDGGVACWGRGQAGQLGDGRLSDSLAPVSVVELGDAVEVVAGLSHTCARKDGGAVHCWGRDDKGQLGRGGTPFTDAWVDVALPGRGAGSSG